MENVNNLRGSMLLKKRKLLQMTVLLVLSLFLIPQASGQSDIGKSYRTKVDGIYQQCDLEGNKTDIKIWISSTAKFTIHKEVGENYIIRFWDWKLENSDREPKKMDSIKTIFLKREKVNSLNDIKVLNPSRNSEKFVLINRTADYQYAYYKIKKSELDIMAKELESRFDPIYGLTTIPFKFRWSGGFDITKDVAIGGAVGVKWKPNRNPDFSLNGLFGIGYSNVTLDSLNTRGKLEKSADYSAFTVYGGLVADWKKVQLGLFVGGDFLAKKDANNWISNGKPWFGIGLGFSIFEHKIPVKEGGN